MVFVHRFKCVYLLQFDTVEGSLKQEISIHRLSLGTGLTLHVVMPSSVTLTVGCVLYRHGVEVSDLKFNVQLTHRSYGFGE